jgi:uncharacterized protein (TIGR02145 family)
MQKTRIEQIEEVGINPGATEADGSLTWNNSTKKYEHISKSNSNHTHLVISPDWDAIEGEPGFIENKPTVVSEQVQSDWNATEGPAFIKNQPTIPDSPVNADWNSTAGLSQILNRPSIPAVQVKSNWLATEETGGLAHILNKPTIPDAQVQSDWNATEGVSLIKNKPTIPNYDYWQFKNIVQTINRGGLYNFFVIEDERFIMADGWHVPTNADWTILRDYLGGLSVAGGKMKEVGTAHWATPNTDATNSSGFNAFSSGLREPTTGEFTAEGETTVFWTSSEGSSALVAWERSINNDSAILFEGTGVSSKACGYSIRGIKDVTYLSDGETGKYVGNDGRIYSTICIGTQEWISENLVETKFRNGDLITVVEGDTEWSLLDSEGMCYLSNDITSAFDLLEQVGTIHSKDILSLIGKNISMEATENGLEFTVPLKIEVEKKVKFTEEGGIAILLTNKTGAASIKGTVVKMHTDIDNAVIIAPTNDRTVSGIIYESGVQDGDEVWICTSGKTKVLINDGEACVRGQWAILGTNGRVTSVPNPAIYFWYSGLIGIFTESKEIGTNVLATVIFRR